MIISSRNTKHRDTRKGVKKMQKRVMREKQFSILKCERDRMIKWYESNGYSLITDNVLENKQAGKRVILITN